MRNRSIILKIYCFVFNSWRNHSEVDWISGFRFTVLITNCNSQTRGKRTSNFHIRSMRGEFIVVLYCVHVKNLITKNVGIFFKLPMSTITLTIQSQSEKGRCRGMKRKKNKKIKWSTDVASEENSRKKSFF